MSRLSSALLISITTWLTSTTNLTRALAHLTKIKAHLLRLLLHLPGQWNLYADLLDLDARLTDLVILDILGSSLLKRVILLERFTSFQCRSTSQSPHPLSVDAVNFRVSARALKSCAALFTSLPVASRDSTLGGCSGSQKVLVDSHQLTVLPARSHLA